MVRFKRGESMQDIAQSLGITYDEVQSIVRKTITLTDRERFAKHFTRVIRYRYSKNNYYE